MKPVELLQFRFSHYNEKARWALDWKSVPHVRRSFLPGFHMVPIRLLTGQRSVPVLRDGQAVVPGSAAIIDHLERAHPEPALYPENAAERERALEVQRWFDDQVGAQARAAFFYEVLPEGAYAASLFSTGDGPVKRWMFRTAFPVIRLAMRANMELSAERAARGLDRCNEALDFILTHAGRDGYLVGDRFSVADLAAAALLSPAVLPPEFPYQPPQPRGGAFQNWVQRWADHPGAAWVRTMYARHRGTSAEVPRRLTTDEHG
jgi:glutathione S-transferase